jgi:hypothetical protein
LFAPVGWVAFGCGMSYRHLPSGLKELDAKLAQADPANRPIEDRRTQEPAFHLQRDSVVFIIDTAGQKQRSSVIEPKSGAHYCWQSRKN